MHQSQLQEVGEEATRKEMQYKEKLRQAEIMLEESCCTVKEMERNSEEMRVQFDEKIKSLEVQLHTEKVRRIIITIKPIHSPHTSLNCV